MGITVERKYSFEETYCIVNKYFEKFGKRIKYETLCHKDDAYPTYVTYVKDSNGKLITRGNGKGISNQSFLSSLFEGIEHSLYESYVLKNIFPIKKIKNKSLTKIVENMKGDYSGNPLYENMTKLQEDVIIPSLKFQSVFDKKKKLTLPFFMYGPSYPRPALNAREAVYTNSIYMKEDELYAELLKKDKMTNYSSLDNTLKYCSSVGGASGIDKEDTMLHALNEVIERHTTSEFLLSAVIYENYGKYSIINKDSLNKSNKEIVNYIDNEYKTNIVIIDITGKIGIPTVMVYEENNKYGKETLLTGYGTSTNIEYAIERALLEYKQTIDLVIYDKTLPEDENYYEVMVKNNVNDFFKKLYYFDYNILKNFKTRNLNDLIEKYRNLYKLKTITEMVESVKTILKNNSYEAYYNIHEVKVDSNASIYYIKVVVPQMCDITDPGPLRLPNKNLLCEVKKESLKNVC